MKIGRKVTVSLLALLMLGGVGASNSQAFAKSMTPSTQEEIQELETPPQVERAHKIVKKSSHVKVAKRARAHRGKRFKRITANNAKQAKKQTRKQNKSKKFVKRIKRHTRKARRRVRKPRKARKMRRTHKVRKPRVSHRRAQAVKAHNKTDWFNDGLTSQELSARNWVTAHESGHEWNILSYGGVCVGYFQLSPGYLGYKNGHVNLDHAHQVKVADHYAKTRYGGWVNAQRFWATHHWY